MADNDSDDEMSVRKSPLTQKPPIWRTIWGAIRLNLLLYLTILSVVMGLVLGFLCRQANPSAYAIYLISFPGEMMMRILKMLILPLITCSLISGVASLDITATGKLGSRAVIYYLLTTVLSCVTGIGVVMIIHPGNPGALDPDFFAGEEKKTMDGNALDAMLDLIRNLFPSNIVQAAFQQAKTQITYEDVWVVEEVGVDASDTNSTVEPASSSYGGATVESILQNITKRVIVDRSPGYMDGMNAIGLITFSLCFGVMMAKLRATTGVLIEMITACNDIITNLLMIFLWYTPVGIMFLIIGNILSVSDLTELAKMVGMYIITVMTGLAIHAFGTLCLIYFIIVRKNPYIYMKNTAAALMTAIGADSSSVALPLTMKCCEENNGVDSRVTRFMLPIGATVNMDGTALYEAVAAIFIAQLNNYDLNAGQVITICLTSIAASVGAATIPSAGLVTMIMVFTSVGLPTEQISLLWMIDWFLDRCRTPVNVMGDAFGAGIVEHLCRSELRKTKRQGSIFVAVDTEDDDTSIPMKIIDENQEP